MRLPAFALLPLGLCLLLTGGCAKKELLVTKKPDTATVRTEPPKAAPAQPAAAPGKLQNAIAAVVNDEIITLYEVNHEAEAVISVNEKKSVLDDASRSRIRHEVLDGLVDKKLVDQKIKELNIKVAEEDIQQAIEDVKKQNNLTQETLLKALAGQGLTYDQYHDRLREQLEKLKLVSMEVRSKIQVGDTEMHEYYDANQSKYREEETFRARHIFFKTGEKATAEEIKHAMTTALMVLAESKSGKDFSELAKTYSEDPAARKDGGDLGLFKKGDMQPELEQAILALKPGEVSELINTPMGLHLIKLEERNPGKLKPFESVRSEIEELIYRKKSDERFSQWAKELRAKASIEIRELPGLL
jgi:peptidyl-prolyl cis-trans isomerase SurA